MTGFFLLVWFTRWLVLFNHIFAFMLSFCTSAVFRRFPLSCSYYSLMLRFSKVKLSRSSSNPELWVALAFVCLFCFKTSDTALFTRALISWPFYRRCLTPWNRMQLAPHPWEVIQLHLMDLVCAYIILHNFISCTGTCIGHTVRVYFYFKFYFIISVLFWGFIRLVWSFDMRRLEGLVAFTVLIILFVLVWFFTLSLEYFPSSFEAHTELYKFSEPLGCRIKPLYE